MEMTDRELDALVAERVMGRVVTGVPFVPAKVKCTDMLSDAAYAEFRKAYPRGSAPVNVPRYSTDPVASAALRDKMRADGWLYSGEDVVDPPSFRARFRCGALSSMAIADTELRAVRDAALKAKECR